MAAYALPTRAAALAQSGDHSTTSLWLAVAALVAGGVVLRKDSKRA
ncbi:MAG: hypothetical protein ABI794_05700 [Betaproteobacteria bacterium]